MRMTHLIALGAALLLAACASKPTGPYPNSSSESLARQIFRAAELDRVPEAGRSMSLLDAASPFNPWVGLANAVGTGSRAAPPAAASVTHIVVWLPKDQVGSADDAADRARDMVWNAAWAAMAAAKWPEGMSPARMPYGRGQYVLSVKGGGCDAADVRCEILNGIRSGAVDGWAPQALGGRPSWRLTITVAPTYVHLGHVNAPSPFFPDVAILQSISERLRDQVAVYVAPGTMAIDDPQIGRSFSYKPFVIFNGQILPL